MAALYRVEKNGVTFHVRPEMIGYYATQGYAIYKMIEEPVTNVADELGRIDNMGETAQIGGRDANEL